MLVALLVAASLAACATGGKSKQPVVTYDTLISTAEGQVASTDFAGALQSFEAAAKADSTRKEPWARLAQLHFDMGNYGRAIVAAEEVLLRDPSDNLAESVLTLGGFRVAAQSLQRLQSSGALTSESAQREARELATLMRETMGPEIAGVPEPASRPARRAAPRRQSAPARAPAAEAAPAPAPARKPTTNPFDKLGGN
ncbi:tetratricopeptide repeat protein [Luteimonas sp. MJ250]|uniref:tetratricopeptide repeat protein n=1 Tax=Luteimonas sp. MJ250 TaxID=3129236 RepID=UPI0031BB48B9